METKSFFSLVYRMVCFHTAKQREVVDHVDVSNSTAGLYRLCILNTTWLTEVRLHLNWFSCSEKQRLWCTVQVHAEAIYFVSNKVQETSTSSRRKGNYQIHCVWMTVHLASPRCEGSSSLYSPILETQRYTTPHRTFTRCYPHLPMKFMSHLTMPLLSTLPLQSPTHPSVTYAIMFYALQLITRGHLLPAPTPSQQNKRQQTRRMTKQCHKR